MVVMVFTDMPWPPGKWVVVLLYLFYWNIYCLVIFALEWKIFLSVWRFVSWTYETEAEKARV